MKLSFFLLAGCITVLPARRQGHRDSMSEEEHSASPLQALSYVNKKGFDLSGTIRRTFAVQAALTDSDRSLVCSPMSALLPLGKLILGTERGKARDELLQAIGTAKTKVKKHFRALVDQLKFLPGVTLNVASRLFVSKDENLISKYEQDSKSVFKSSVEKLNYEKPAAAAAVVNRWVKAQTYGMIDSIVKPGDISPSTSLIIVNAVYFWGTWVKRFKKVEVDTFHSPSGVMKIPMMSRTGMYNYTESDALGAQILEIPYHGGQASFVIVLPKSKNGLPVLLRALNLAPDLLNDAMLKMRVMNVRVTIPKFKVESDLNLNVLYEKVGVSSIFSDSRSGLTRIIRDKGVYVTRAVQKCVIIVSETGTEAAAVTEMQIVAMSLGPAFKADRPFMFFVKAGQQQLFTGTFTNL